MAFKSTTKVIVLGMDGLDPNILEKLMANGDLPAFSSIRETGTYRRLVTTNPSQSPVAWSTIATGSNPGYHGIFDFITRNPENYLPMHSIVKLNPKNILARRSSMFLPVRKGTPFWAVTSQEGVPTTVIKWPVTFPPEEVRGGMLSGLGVLDLKGSVGRYAFYTTGNIPQDGDRKGDAISVSPGSGTTKAMITGPDKSKIPMEIAIDEQHLTATITIGGKDYVMKEGEWTDWIPLTFTIGSLRHVPGICQFYLDSVKPELRLYLSPIQADPSNPAFPISYPDEYASELAHNIGRYSTLGIPEDTNALRDGCFGEEAFLSLCDNIMVEREKMLYHELERFKEGLLAIVLDTTDRIQHIFWSTRDTEHPAYDEAYARKYQNVIEDYYKRMDKVLARVLEYSNQDTVICIMSDHGFTSFRKAVHLNSWLVQNGLMVLKKPVLDEEGAPLFKNVIWEKTKAYAVGFSSVYLNLKGREAKGTVNPGQEATQMRKKIAEVLTSLKDPKNGQSVIRNVYTSEELYSGPYINDAPDLVVGFKPYYRASWQTAIGGMPPRIIQDNQKKWTGDHLLDSGYVPGVLLMNRKTSVPQPSVTDIAPTILSWLHIAQPQTMEGSPLLE